MEKNLQPIFSVSDFVAITNQTLEYAYPSVVLEGEVESFKVNQGKFVFFNLKDAAASVGCFMMVFNLRVPLEDGMKVVVRGRPKLTNFGKFSITIDSVKPAGEGSIKRGFELLKATLEKEGLFAPERKRVLPAMPQRVGVLASVESAGYADFMKIVDQRWGGVEFSVYHTLVQGLDAPDALCRGLEVLNQAQEPLDVIVIIRGGGSADDLSAFNDEVLVRAVATSRTPTIVGVGHETDTTLCDLVADVRAATPSNAAQLLVPDRQAIAQRVADRTKNLLPRLVYVLERRAQHVATLDEGARRQLAAKFSDAEARLERVTQMLRSYDPRQVLRRGYSILRGAPRVGGVVEVETHTHTITAEVQAYEQK